MIKLTNTEIENVRENLKFSVWARQTYDYKNQETKFHIDDTPNQAVHAIETLQQRIAELIKQLQAAERDKAVLLETVGKLQQESFTAQQAYGALLKKKWDLEEAFDKLKNPVQKLWAPEGYVAHRSSGAQDCQKCAFDNNPYRCLETPCTPINHPQRVNVYYEKL